MISGETIRCRNVGQILRYHVQNKLLSQEKLCCQKKNCCQTFHQCTKTNCKRKSPGCYINRNKMKNNPYGDLVDQEFFWNLMRILLAIETHIAQLKIMKHQGHNVPMKVNQKKKNTQNFCTFKFRATNITRWCNWRGMNSLRSKQREFFNVVHTWPNDYVKYDVIMLHQPTYFFQTVEAQVNIIWWKWYATPY